MANVTEASTRGGQAPAPVYDERMCSARENINNLFHNLDFDTNKERKIINSK